MRNFGLTLLAFMAVQSSANAASEATATSPNGTVSVSISLDGDGRPSYQVSRKGKPILAPSRLGFLFADALKIDRKLTITGQDIRDFDETWPQPWGEWTKIRNKFRELKVHLKETTTLARIFIITFRLYEDGVGFRYEFPDQPNIQLKFLRDVPTDWSETRVLNGEIGDFANIARKERGGKGWYVGGVGDETERTVSFKLDFLTPGKRYNAEIYRDGDDADYRTEKRHSIIIENKTLSSSDRMTTRIAPGGGFAIRFTPAK